VQDILCNGDMTMQMRINPSLPQEEGRGHYIFQGCDDLIITIQHQSRFVLLYGVQLIATTILLALAPGADRAISMSKDDCADCGLCLVKAV
jgi:hypothetical protein